MSNYVKDGATNRRPLELGIGFFVFSVARSSPSSALLVHIAYTHTLVVHSLSCSIRIV